MFTMEDPILKFHPDTVATVRKANNLNKPGDIDQVVDSLRDWLKKQHHLTKKEYSRDYLERSIMMTKGSVERTKLQIDKLCSLRTLLPKFFENCDARHGYTDLKGICASVLLPQLTEDHYRVYILKILGNGLTRKILFDVMTFGMLYCEYYRRHDYPAGVIAILDFRDANIMESMSSIDFGDVHSLITILMNGYAVRFKGIHIITSSTSLKSIFGVVKKMFDTKIASRFYIHDDMETVYEHIPKNTLPSELGGKEKSITTLNDEWIDVLSTKENIEYFREMSQAVSNEPNEMKQKLNGMDLGLAGTFRSLTVD